VIKLKCNYKDLILRLLLIAFAGLIASCEAPVKRSQYNFVEPCPINDILENKFELEAIPSRVIKGAGREYVQNHPNNYNVIFASLPVNPQFGFSISRAPILSGNGVAFKKAVMTLCRDNDVMIARYVENECDETKDKRENFLVSLDHTNLRITCDLRNNRCTFGWRRGFVLSQDNIKGQNQKSQAPIYISLKFDREFAGCYAQFYDFFNRKVDDIMFDQNTIRLSASDKKYDLTTLRRQPYFHNKGDLNHR